MQNDKYFTKICLPDGSDYWLLNLLSSNNAEKILEENKKKIFKSESEVRVVFERGLTQTPPSLKGVGGDFLKGYLKASLWQTNFLFYTPEEILDFIESSHIFKENENLASQIKLYEANKNLENREKEILKDFMIGSFGYKFLKDDNGQKILTPKKEKLEKIENKFEESLIQPKNRIFLLKIGGKIVGSFTLAINLEQKFIQLESVAGRGFEGKYKEYYWKGGSNKIDLILIKLFEILKNKYQGFSLFFTCSKAPVVEMYESAGLKFNSDIQGLKLLPFDHFKKEK